MIDFNYGIQGRQIYELDWNKLSSIYNLSKCYRVENILKILFLTPQKEFVQNP